MVVYVVATLSVKSDKRAEFLDNVKALISGTRGEAGCERYDLTNAVEDPDTFVFVERWASREALQAHFGSPHMLTWRGVSADYFSAKTVVEIVKAADVEVL